VPLLGYITDKDLERLENFKKKIMPPRINKLVQEQRKKAEIAKLTE
jgi:hypothetical protein